MSYSTTPFFLNATLIGVAGSAALSTLSWSISFFTMPALLLLGPSKTTSIHLARQWRLVYDIGKFTGPPISAVSAGSLIFAMTRIPAELSLQRQLYVAAAALLVSIMPFTLIFLAPTNKKLLEMAAGEGEQRSLGKQEGERAEELIRKWAGLNAMRGVAPVLGIGCVLVALNC